MLSTDPSLTVLQLLPDGASNINAIMRLPGTDNNPGAPCTLGTSGAGEEKKKGGGGSNVMQSDTTASGSIFKAGAR